MLDMRHVAEGADTTMVTNMTQPGGEFEKIFDEDGVIVARRIRTPGSG